MNDTFQEREKGFERKYQLDQDQQFRARSRRDRIFGEWAAGKLGLWGLEIEAYAVQVIDLNFEKSGDDDMLRKVCEDLKTKNIAIDDKELCAQLRQAEAAATREILG
jgi:hypothetical protein